MGFLVFFCGVGKRDYDFKEINVKVFNFFIRFKFFRGRDSSVALLPQNDGWGVQKPNNGRLNNGKLSTNGIPI